MCSVTFIPANDTVFITHNRDEKSIRSMAVPPKEYVINGVRLLFPRDGQAGGSWIALHENGQAAVLLNGAFEKHLHQPPYRKSRGLAFLDIAASHHLLEAWYSTVLEGIEPFTIILWTHGALWECRWDGQKKYAAELPTDTCHTWSSVTLYDSTVINKRKKWFHEWLRQPRVFTTEHIIQFHLLGGDGDIENNLRMNRNGQLLTVSITALELTGNQGTMEYLDLQQNQRYTQELLFTKVTAIK